ncbi:hypothetical protein AX16_000293 [Volvariella volvacea WC 439]|nr:hypothetical protein AX16_000293 [Volvariella volvacea WC 439]
MPLRTVSEPDPTSLTQVPEEYLIFFSSIVDGKLWCPDCVAVDRTIQNVFSPDDGPSGLIVYVGDRPTWKSPTNKYRSDLWNVQSVPTVIKIKDGKEVGRRVDVAEINGDLQSLLG